MNSLHDHNHKRTSITELLNPIAAAPASSIDSYANSTQLPTLHPQYLPPPQSHHGGPPSSYGPPQIGSGSSFSLRAASWDHGTKDDMAGRRPEADPSACRYTSTVQSHPLYPEPVTRVSRQMDEQSNYGMDVASWQSSHDPATVNYGPAPHMIAPMYSDERTDYNHQQQQQQQYEHDMQGYPNAWQYQDRDRASVRLAMRGSAPSQMMQPMHRGPASPPAFYGHPMYAAIPIAPHMMQQPMPGPAEKRPAEQVDEETVPKAKKARKSSKATEGNPTSRRGYNAKKRSEAAQIAAQNAQLMPTVSYAHVTAEKGKEKAGSSNLNTMRIVTDDGTQHHETSGPLHPELQFARCMSNRYRSEEFPRCVSCTRRWAGDTCRFQGIRFFLKNEARDIVGISFVESQKPDSPSMNFPVKWNVPLEAPYLKRIKTTVARALLPTLRLELEHLSLPEVIRRPRESEVRATCDTCMTSIFSSSWMCRLCGREACAECFEQVKELTVDREGASEAEVAALQVRREKHAHLNPFFLSCTRRNEHQAKDFSPMSRFCKSELVQAIKEMDELLASSTDKDLAEPAAPLTNGGDSAPATNANGHNISANTAPNDRSDASPTLSSSSDADVPTWTALPENPAELASGLPSHDTPVFADAELNDEIFREVWTKGQPLVVTGVLHKFQIQWTPEYFRNKYGAQSCLILECLTDQNKRVTVGEFFSWFGKYEGRRDCWKLKDWPPSTDFKTAFPELYDDFSRATPVPNYVRRDGVLNVASHFPANTVAPDLGPKMYNAMASFDSTDSKGSTRLHMDMADAVNIMLYSSLTPEGRPGTAAWDLFRSEDTPKLRKFLRKKFKGQYQHDPIHSQQFYLDPMLRYELYQEYGVKSHRIYQKPGDAVFIPAGCAHQVCNLADCIKVACDFVSPENIERCETLTKEFREQNQSMAWKEDVLQLRTMMWFAWLSCCRQEKKAEH